MAVWGCGFCGFQIRYHGEPEGKYPVEHTFCMIDDWRELEKENKDIGWLEWENEEKFFYAWRCARCGTFMFFDCKLKRIGTYTPKDEFSSEAMQEPFEFGPFWNDFQWFDITENSTPSSEVLAKYPQTRWFAKNDDELRFYSDEARTNCVAQFRRLNVITPVTVQTMSLKSFKKMLATWDDIQFCYHSKYANYNFMREDDGINIYHGSSNEQLVYHADAATDVEEIVNAKIFPDGRSIAEAQAEIEL